MGDESLPSLLDRLQDLCLDRGISVGTAESCTGGLVAKLLTDKSGSSGFFRGGIVSYANEVKAALLDVPVEMIEAHGAVSAQVARAMAAGARDRLSVDVAVAVSGVAGPTGGGAAKPVGLTYVAVAGTTGSDVRRFLFGGDRAANREAAARAAIEMLLASCEAEPGRAQ
jgi:PncC family amidohydrolase